MPKQRKNVEALTQRVFENSLHPCVTSERSLRVVPTYTNASVIGCNRNHLEALTNHLNWIVFFNIRTYKALPLCPNIHVRMSHCFINAQTLQKPRFNNKILVSADDHMHKKNILMHGILIYSYTKQKKICLKRRKACICIT